MKIDNKEEQIKVILSLGSSNRKRLLIFLVKIFLQKSDVRYTYYISLVEAIIRHQKVASSMQRTCSSSFTSCKN